VPLANVSNTLTGIVVVGPKSPPIALSWLVCCANKQLLDPHGARPFALLVRPLHHWIHRKASHRAVYQWVKDVNKDYNNWRSKTSAKFPDDQQTNAKSCDDRIKKSVSICNSNGQAYKCHFIFWLTVSGCLCTTLFMLLQPTITTTTTTVSVPV